MCDGRDKDGMRWAILKYKVKKCKFCVEFVVGVRRWHLQTVDEHLAISGI